MERDRKMAIIFDMDGVLVDTEPQHMEAYRKAMGEEAWNAIDFSRYIGMGDHESCEELVREFPFSMTAEKLRETKDRIYESLLEREVRPLPGAVEAVRQAREEGRRTAIASSSRVKEIRIVVRALGAEDLFDTIAGGDEVRRAKPAPDVYILAARRLGIPPNRCMAVEDSPNGVMAARAAGMKVIAIPSRETAGKDFSQADAVLESLAGLQEESTRLEPAAFPEEEDHAP